MLNININTLFTIINLVIFYVLFRLFLFKPIRGIIAKREEEIQKGYADAETAKQDADKLKQQYEQSVAGIEEERKEKISQAQAKANQEYERILTDAHIKKDKIVEEARDLARAEADRQLADARNQIADMVKAFGGNLVGQAASNSELYDEFLDAAQGEQQQKASSGEKTDSAKE